MLNRGIDSHIQSGRRVVIADQDALVTLGGDVLGRRSPQVIHLSLFNLYREARQANGTIEHGERL